MLVTRRSTNQFAYSKDGHAIDLWHHLPEHRRRGRDKRRPQANRFADELSLKHRPDVVDTREEFGQANVTSLVEMVSRFTLLLKNADRHSKPVMGESSRASLRSRSMPESPSPSIEVSSFGPASPASRPRRRHLVLRPAKYPSRKAPTKTPTNPPPFARETDQTAQTNRSLAAICLGLNATPRKCLGYRPHHRSLPRKGVGRRRRPALISTLLKSALRYEATV